MKYALPRGAMPYDASGGVALAPCSASLARSNTRPDTTCGSNFEPEVPAVLYSSQPALAVALHHLKEPGWPNQGLPTSDLGESAWYGDNFQIGIRW